MPVTHIAVLVTGGLVHRKPSLRGAVASRPASAVRRRPAGVYAPSTGPAAVEPARARRRGGSRPPRRPLLRDRRRNPPRGPPGRAKPPPCDEVGERTPSSRDSWRRRPPPPAPASYSARLIRLRRRARAPHARALAAGSAEPYAASKLAAELAVRERRSAGAATRRSYARSRSTARASGPDMAFARWIAALLGKSHCRGARPPGAARDFTYVDDAVAGLIAALDRGRPAAAYNVSGGRGVPVRRGADAPRGGASRVTHGLESRVSPAPKPA